MDRETAEPIAGGWSVVEVNSAHPVDVGSVIERIHAIE
jgi:hypothetical protein